MSGDPIYHDVETPVSGHYRVTSTEEILTEKVTQIHSKEGFQNQAFELTEIENYDHHPHKPRAKEFNFSETSSHLQFDTMKKIPNLARQFLAEFLGTFMLVIFGDGAIAQYKFLEGQQRNFLSVALGYGLALMVGILVSGNVSGGHLNPAVTLSMACIKKCKWICVPVYWMAQYLGALCGAAVLFGVYADGIALNGGKAANAGIFASYPTNENLSPVTLVVDQALGTGLLLIIILAVTDKKNMNVSSGLIPLLIGLGLAAIHISFAYNAGCAINPARDFSPRLLTLIAGFGNNVFVKNNSFFWIPWIIPHIGGVLGALTYFFMIEMHHRDDLD